MASCYLIMVQFTYFQVLQRLSHRGSECGESGDGAGIMTALPFEFLSLVLKTQFDIELDKGEFGTGLVFFPKDEESQVLCEGSRLNLIVDCKGSVCQMHFGLWTEIDRLANSTSRKGSYRTCGKSI